ncbi:MAG: AI-2E family transporter [Lachnospiraceae bacterium]|nr:AI-2E family transporter [Lachnospiraceae bacterium]
MSNEEKKQNTEGSGSSVHFEEVSGYIYDAQNGELDPRTAEQEESRQHRRQKTSAIFRGSTYLGFGATAFLTFAACLLFYYVLFRTSDLMTGFHRLKAILMPVFVGLIIAYLLSPVLNFIERRFLLPFTEKHRIFREEKRPAVVRSISIIITAALTLFALYLVISMMLRRIIPSISNLLRNFNVYIQNGEVYINKLLQDRPEAGDYVTDLLDRYSKDISAWFNDNISSKSADLLRILSQGFIGFLKRLWNFVIGFIISIYVLGGKERMVARAKKVTFAVFSRGTANDIISAMQYTHKTFIGFISGKIVDSVIIGLLCFIGTTIMQTPYASLVSLFIGITNIIPFFGPYMGAIPSAILIFLVEPAHPLNVVYFLIFILILQQFDGNFLGPKILANSTGLAGFWVIFSITLFGGLFGVFGMVIGVPVFAVFYNGMKKSVRRKLRKKGYPEETDPYIHADHISRDGVLEDLPDEELPVNKPVRKRMRKQKKTPEE